MNVRYVHKERNRAKCRIFSYITAILFILMLAGLWIAVPIVSSAVRHEMIEWERVHDEMVRDIGKLRVEKMEILDEVLQLRAERDEKRREWELEREEHDERRRGHAPFWGEARLLNEQCPSDRHRRYEARMYNLLVEDDWFEACKGESIQIAGRTLSSPQSCINRVRRPCTLRCTFCDLSQGLDNGVRGFWTIEVNTRECPRTIWDRVSQLNVCSTTSDLSFRIA